MIIEKPIFWDYLTYDEDGFMDGIKEDAPEDVKKAYEKYLEEQNELEKVGIKD